jgi:small subunit ribosomal protein S18
MAVYRKKQDYLSANGIKYIDYKDTELLRMFLTPHGQIMSRRRTNFNAKQQRALALAVKRARIMGLLPFVTA